MIDQAKFSHGAQGPGFEQRILIREGFCQRPSRTAAVYGGSRNPDAAEDPRLGGKELPGVTLCSLIGEPTEGGYQPTGKVRHGSRHFEDFGDVWLLAAL